MQVLRSRYQCSSDLIPRMQANSSFTWKGIYVAWLIILQNIGWYLGNGNFISFWKTSGFLPVVVY